MAYIYIYACIGVVWGVNVGIYGIHGVFGIGPLSGICPLDGLRVSPPLVFGLSSDCWRLCFSTVRVGTQWSLHCLDIYAKFENVLFQ